MGFTQVPVCCCWTWQAQHGQRTSLIHAAQRGKLRQGELREPVGDSQLSPGHAQTPLACRKTILQPLPPLSQPPGTPTASPAWCTMHPGAPRPCAGTQYLRLHVPHVRKSLLLPLKMGLEGQGRDTGEKKS